MLKNFEEVINRVKTLISGKPIKQFAADIGMTQQTVALYMNGERKPSLEFIYNICCTFGVSSDWLLGISTDNAPTVRAGDGAAVNIGSGSANAANCKDCPILLDFIKRRSGG